MNNENPNDIDDENPNDIDDKFIMLLVAENGSFSWIISPEISEEQEEILRRVHAVVNHPSIILLLVLLIEIYLIKFSNFIKDLFSYEEID